MDNFPENNSDSKSEEELFQSNTHESSLNEFQLSQEKEQVANIQDEISPPSPRIIKALEKSINQSSNLLFKPFRLSVWSRLISVIILIILFSLITFNTFANLYSALPIDIREQIRYEFENLFLGGIFVILLVIVALLFGIFLLLFAGVVFYTFRFVFIELITGRKKEIASSFLSNMKNGLRAYFWSIFLFFAQVVYLSIVFLVLTLKLKSDFSELDLSLLNMLSGMSSFFYLFLINLPFIIINVIFGGFIMPIMLYKNVGVFMGWGIFLMLFFKNLLRFILYFIMFFVIFFIFLIGSVLAVFILSAILMFIYMAIAAISPIVAIVLLSFLCLILLVPIILIFVPLMVFFRLLPIAFLGQIDRVYKFSQ